MEFLQEITLDYNSNTAYTTVGAKQGDHQSRNIKIHLTKNGEDWTIPSGANASYRVRKPDGHAIWNHATIDLEDNVIYITLTEQTLAVPGRAYADILITQGIGENKQILSTVSFIIIIMASPDIVESIVSSNEFGEILDLTNNANTIINESEAWATGQIATQPVAGDFFEYDTFGTTNLQYTINEKTFREYVGIEYGRTIIYTFTCIENTTIEQPFGIWRVEYNGIIISPIWTSTPPENRPYPDNNTFYMSDYGFEFTEGTALQSNVIQVTVTDHEIYFENNAKYYSEQAEASRQAIEDLTVTSEIIGPVETGTHIDVEKTVTQGVVNFNFKIPKGNTGDVNFMTFDVDTDLTSPFCGQLIMYRPQQIAALDCVDFTINEDKDSENFGYLCVQIYPGGN